jgi:hypothetical protein
MLERLVLGVGISVANRVLFSGKPFDDFPSGEIASTA